MDFFEATRRRPMVSDADDEPGAEAEPQLPDWQGPTTTIFGHVVAANAVVVRTQHAFIGLPAFTVYPTGLMFEIKIAVHRGGWSRDRWEAVEDSFWGRRGVPHRTHADDALQVGVLLSDGRRAVASDRWDRPAEEPTPPVLCQLGGSGSGGGRNRLDASTQFWLWPLPEPGPLDLVIAWSALEVPTTMHQVRVDPPPTPTVPYWP